MKSRNNFRRYLAGILSLVMVLSLGFGNVSLAAETDGAGEETKIAADLGAEVEGTDTEGTDTGADISGTDSGTGADTSKTETAGGTEDFGTQTPSSEGAGVSEDAGNVGGDEDEYAFENYALGASKIYDLSGSNIANNYNALKNAADAELNSSANGNIPITNWKRNAYNQGVIVTDIEQKRDYWSWSNVAGMKLSLQGDENVWDGSRQTTHAFNNKDYLKENYVTALNGTLYDSATWTPVSGKGEYTTGHMTLHRFQGTFTLPAGINLSENAFTLQPVTGDDRIYINDFTFVFVHPANVALTDNNFMDYMAFWTGGAINKDANNLANYRGRYGTKSTYGNASGLAAVTNGWYCESVTDNAGDIIAKTYNGNQTQYVVDIVSGDNAAGGGMYRLKMTQEEKTKYPVSFLKTDADTGDLLEGAEFSLDGIGGSALHYTATSDAQGKVTFQVVPGTYTMRETKAPTSNTANYEPITGTWTVTVDNDGDYTIKVDGNGTGGANISKDDGEYYITNENSIKGSFNFQKVTKDGSALEGATFTLYQADGTTEIDAQTSDAQGNVSFENIKIGNGYILKETSVPEGYVASTDTWTVDVASDGTTQMYLTGDKDKEPVRAIVNYTKGEIVVQSIEKEKKILNVSNKDYNNREYTIDLTASSTGSIVQPGKEAKIVIVLDSSGSMTYKMGNMTRKAAAGEAVKSFVNAVAAKSPKSQIAIVAFRDGYNNRNGTLISELQAAGAYIENNEANLTKAVDTYIEFTKANSGTYPSRGLNLAKEILAPLECDPTTKHVVMLCDGASDEPYNTTKAANDVKQIATLHVIGFALGSSGSGDSATIEKWATSDKNAYTAENKDELIKVFQTLVESTTTPQIIEGATVTDVIDARFELTADQRKKLISAGVSVVDNTDGTTTVTWNNQTINPANDNTPGWHQTIRIKAKDDFIGGNYIPTNGTESKITVEGTDTYFDKPTVNVKLLELNTSNEETTVFIQDAVTPGTLAGELKDNFEIKKLDGSTIVIPEDCQLTEDEVHNLVNGTTGEVIKKYSYQGTNDNVGTFTYTFEAVKGNKDEHLATETGDKVEDYKIKVVYTPDTTAVRKESLADSYVDAQGTEATTSLVKDAHYYINVVAGSIQITKQIDKMTEENLEGAPVFTFKIVREYNGTTQTWYRTVKMSEKTATAELLSNLPRGTYTVTELKTQRYNLESVKDNNGNNRGTVSGQSITFHIGAGKNESNYEALNGSVLFTNNKTDGGKRTDTDVVMNRFTKNPDGTWTVSQEKVPQTPKETTNVNRTFEAILPDNTKMKLGDSVEDLDI